MGSSCCHRPDESSTQGSSICFRGGATNLMHSSCQEQGSNFKLKGKGTAYRSKVPAEEDRDELPVEECFLLFLWILSFGKNSASAFRENSPSAGGLDL